jgi:hypothetical protein
MSHHCQRATAVAGRGQAEIRGGEEWKKKMAQSCDRSQPGINNFLRLADKHPFFLSINKYQFKSQSYYDIHLPMKNSLGSCLK